MGSPRRRFRAPGWLGVHGSEAGIGASGRVRGGSVDGGFWTREA